MNVYNVPEPVGPAGVDEELLDEPPQPTVISTATDANTRPAATFPLPICERRLVAPNLACLCAWRLNLTLNLNRTDPIDFANE